METSATASINRGGPRSLLYMEMAACFWGLEGKRNRLIEDAAAVNWWRRAESKRGLQKNKKKNQLNFAPDKNDDYESARGKRSQFPSESCILEMIELNGRSY